MWFPPFSIAIAGLVPYLSLRNKAIYRLKYPHILLFTITIDYNKIPVPPRNHFIETARHQMGAWKKSIRKKNLEEGIIFIKFVPDKKYIICEIPSRS